MPGSLVLWGVLLAFCLVLGVVAVALAGVSLALHRAGRRGARGGRGTRGATGWHGESGEDGADGPTGAAGATGPDGASANTGADGGTGPRGAPGSVGPTGAQGFDGETGPAGPLGALVLYAFASPTDGPTTFEVPTSSSGRGYVVLYGGGGGGAGCVFDPNDANYQMGGGGGAGSWLTSSVSATPGSSLLVTVGNGGTGGAGTLVSTGLGLATGIGAGSDGGLSAISGFTDPILPLIANGGGGAPGLQGGDINGASLGGAGGYADPGIGPPGAPYFGLSGQAGQQADGPLGLGGDGGTCPNGGAGGFGGTVAYDSNTGTAFPQEGEQPGGGGGGGSTVGIEQMPTDGAPGAPGLVLIYLYQAA